MYCLNFQMRKRNVDTIVADNLMSNTPTEKKNETN